VIAQTTHFWKLQVQVGHPFGFAQRSKKGGECGFVSECGVAAMELQLVRGVCRNQHLQEQSTKQAREHAHGQEEDGPARDPP
jgi:hypothetical protein